MGLLSTDSLDQQDPDAGCAYRLCLAGSGGMVPGNFEILHALWCVLGTSEAPFSCMHTAYIRSLKLPSSFNCFRKG